MRKGPLTGTLSLLSCLSHLSSVPPTSSRLDLRQLLVLDPFRSIALITLVNTQNVSVNEIVNSSSIQCAESKYGLRIQFLALVVIKHEVCLNA